MTYGQEKQANSEPRAIAGAGLNHRSALRNVAAVLMAAAGLLVGCSDAGDGVYEKALSLVAEESGASPALDGSVGAGAESDLHDLWYQELRDGPAVQHLGVARLLSEFGAIELLDSYIVNIPTGAFFLPNFELQAAMSASRIMHDSAGDEARVVYDFERELLSTVRNAELFWSPAPSEPDPLHEAFFKVFEECGRDSPWPEVKLADREGNSAGDVLHIDRESGISHYEYRELLHVCGRYAATYPTLDPEVRDELLSSQRTYFAQGILDRLDDVRWPVEVPERYQAEIDGLRKSGW
ncbi:hypothetical protein [Candidatus Poriferisodalis sp.]|uniref:hypothetical protein n=1 Tax=Candidatus Poriferisodalis sp. TaxID=3101277 RepID=UPI003AF86140